jgi:hypothetical protein
VTNPREVQPQYLSPSRPPRFLRRGLVATALPHVFLLGRLVPLLCKPLMAQGRGDKSRIREEAVP